ncbi:NUDIX hydrolase [Robertmurraya siralis]|uniref:NUDIX hydrolase n=1 Tax=Robertmurraya siralis TaxID=77777 RepID=UPI001F45421B|nr:NUDIX hydrolase [Robertmurraya siralis]
MLTKDKNIILVEQYRHGSQKNQLEIPAGKVEDNEDASEAIKREVKEETGFISDYDPILLGEFYVNPAINTNKIKTYLLVESYKAYQQKLDDTEEIKYLSLKFNKTDELINNKKIEQLFSVTAIYLAKKYLAENNLIY